MLKILSELRILFAVCFLSTLFLFLFDSAFSQPITTFPKLQKYEFFTIEIRLTLVCRLDTLLQIHRFAFQGPVSTFGARLSACKDP